MEDDFIDDDERFWEEVDLKYEQQRDDELLRKELGEEIWKYGYR